MEAPFAAARSKGNSTTNGGGSGVRSSSLKQQPAAALAGVSLARWAASVQLDSLVLRVKGLREAIYVRCLHAK